MKKSALGIVTSLPAISQAAHVADGGSVPTVKSTL
jgi:hypothetical protein